jgi:nicotinamide riboside kinase
MSGVVRVAILGAESSGKSTLAGALAVRHDSLWVPEFLREFVDTHQRVPHEEDQFLIARTQLQRERECELKLLQRLASRAGGRFLFCDTTPANRRRCASGYTGNCCRNWRRDPSLSCKSKARCSSACCRWSACWRSIQIEYSA